MGQMCQLLLYNYDMAKSEVFCLEQHLGIIARMDEALPFIAGLPLGEEEEQPKGV